MLAIFRPFYKTINLLAFVGFSNVINKKQQYIWLILNLHHYCAPCSNRKNNIKSASAGKCSYRKSTGLFYP